MRIIVALLIGAFLLSTAVAAEAAPRRLGFTLHYEIDQKRFTQLKVTGLTPRADLRVTVKCPAGQACPPSFTMRNVSGTVKLKRLLNTPLPAGTKVTVRASAGKLSAARTIALR
jgi:hypothetical protein